MRCKASRLVRIDMVLRWHPERSLAFRLFRANLLSCIRGYPLVDAKGLLLHKRPARLENPDGTKRRLLTPGPREPGRTLFGLIRASARGRSRYLPLGARHPDAEVFGSAETPSRYGSVQRIRQSNPSSGRGVFLMHCGHHGNRRV